MVLKKPAPAAGKGTPPGATGNAAAPKGAPPRAAGKAPAPTSAQIDRTPKTFSISKGIQEAAERVVIYGTGAIGKSTLASMAPDPIFLDVERGTRKLPVQRVDDIESFSDLRDALQTPSLFDGCKSVVIDTFTVAQELGTAHTIATVPHEKGHRVTSIEGYGFGKGYQHTLETMMLLLGDLDRHVREGRNVILLCHVVTEKAPNPEGEDFLRYEPDLQNPPKTGRLRDKIKNWCDHLVFLSYDLSVADGKAKGHGSRTAYFYEMPTFWAKSRAGSEPIPFTIENGPMIWDALLRTPEVK